MESLISKSYYARYRSNRFVQAALALSLLLILFVAFFVKISITGQHEGIFLLKRDSGRPFEIKDDLFLGDGHRLLYAIDLDKGKECIDKDVNPGDVCLKYKWDDKDGSGYVENYMPDGGRIFTSFSRFDYGFTDADVDKEMRVHGLFVGGGLPENIEQEKDKIMLSDTGMAYYGGDRWYHLWCNVNEGLASADGVTQCTPNTWKFLGSKVLNASSRELAIKSSHQAVVDGVPLDIQRYVYFEAGEPYLLLSMFITNAGDRNVAFYYVYGDEPWVGDFGSSAGNVGWVKDKLINYTQFVDTKKNTYAGMFDYGNDAIGKEHNYTMTANFLEWFGNEKPIAYFSNAPTDYPKDGAPVPLMSNSRYIGLQWGPRELAPGQSMHIVLAVGMAQLSPKTGFPVKPHVDVPDDLKIN